MSSLPSAAREQTRGMMIMAAAMLVLPLIDLVGKWLATHEGVSPGQIALARFVVQSLVMAAIIIRLRGWAGLKSKRFGANFVRGLLIGTASLVFFIAVKYMPVADAISIFFVEPLLLTLLSGLILHEPIGWRRWSAVAAGFAGALIVIEPSFDRFGPVSLLPLVTALLFSVYMLLSRRLTGEDPPLVMQFVAGLGGVAASAAAIVVGVIWAVPDLAPGIPAAPVPVILLVIVGLVAAFGHMMVTVASQLARASVIAPFQYLEIVTATFVGLLVFGDFPSASKWLGIAIIIASGLFVFWRESQSDDGGPDDPVPPQTG